MLTLEERHEAVDVAVVLLNHLQWWGTAWKPRGPDSLHSATPASTTQAVLQLLAHVTKEHELAVKVCQLAFAVWDF